MIMSPIIPGLKESQETPVVIYRSPAIKKKEDRVNEEKSISSNDGMCHGGLAFRCSSEPKNPGDSNEPSHSRSWDSERQAGEIASAEESGLKIFHDYMTTGCDTINCHLYHERIRRRDRCGLPPSLPPVSQRGRGLEYLPELASAAGTDG